MKIEYKLIELDKEKNTEGIESFLELTDTHLHWKARYYADIPLIHDDPAGAWGNKMKSYETWVKRVTVMGVGVSYIYDSKVWQVFIDASGLAGTIELYFKRESEANVIAEKIVNWMLQK